ncbi:hypothetical protein [Tsukamurella pulmonis]|uniref:hypothetical protein n=1 Tax=Tsukamurella pulmonis TaxID=47312 RepID=UPI001111A526|nr:hypothetical protein [Tsukamurella pulmonis]
MVSTKSSAASIVMATAAATGVLASTAPVPAASAGSVANIPLNIIQTLANMPAEQVAGAAQTADALEMSGNWWLYTPNNVLGFDQADIAKVNGIMAWLMPVPEIAQAFADPINVTFEANFPMTADCTGAPAPCGDSTYWTDYFKVMPWKLIQGVSYGTVTNTIDPSITMPWSNSTQRIDVFGVARAMWNTLTKDPEGFQGLPSIEQITSTYERLGLATLNSLNPFVDGTYCLPCQFVVKGAPGSLARVPLFGNWYTLTDLGQEFTDENWVGRPPGIPDADDVEALSLWSAEGQQRLWKDIDGSIQRALSGDLIDVDEMWKSIETIATGFQTIIPSPEDLGGAAESIGRDFQGLMDSISSSFGPSTYGPPSAGSALSRLGAATAPADEEDASSAKAVKDTKDVKDSKGATDSEGAKDTRESASAKDGSDDDRVPGSGHKSFLEVLGLDASAGAQDTGSAEEPSGADRTTDADQPGDVDETEPVDQPDTGDDAAADDAAGADEGDAGGDADPAADEPDPEPSASSSHVSWKELSAKLAEDKAKADAAQSDSGGDQEQAPQADEPDTGGAQADEPDDEPDTGGAQADEPDLDQSATDDAGGSGSSDAGSTGGSDDDSSGGDADAGSSSDDSGASDDGSE